VKRAARSQARYPDPPAKAGGGDRVKRERKL
jgi:hypothetical protein